MEEKVKKENVEKVIQRWKGIKVERMMEGEREKMLRMEEEIGKRVVGKGEEVKEI